MQFSEVQILVQQQQSSGFIRLGKVPWKRLADEGQNSHSEMQA